MEFNSVKEWKDYCFNTHELYIKDAYFQNWIKEKDICIFNHSGLGRNQLEDLKHGIEKAIALIGLHFNVKIPGYRLYDTSNAVKNGFVMSGMMLKMTGAARKMNNTHNASVFIVDKPIKSQAGIIKDGEALTYVSEGVSIFTFDSLKRYPSAFLRNRALHESFHLLGLNVHHEETKVKGYRQSGSCNMEYNAPSDDLCDKCKDALKSFWKGMEHATKKQFVRD